MQKFAAFAILTIALLLVAGCSQPSPAPATTPLPTTNKPVTPQKTLPVITSTPIVIPPTDRPVTVNDYTVVITDDLFNPGTMTVPPGATVRWVNEGKATQRLRFADNSLSQLMSTSQSWSKIYNSPGVYDYTSTVNPRMSGTVIVRVKY